jgi:uncharacterized protein
MVNAHRQRSSCRAWLGVLLALWLPLVARAAAEIPTAPATYVTDKAGVLTPVAFSSLNARLERYERATSTQIVIAVYPKLPDGEVLQDYAVRVFDVWKPGLKGKDNGLIIFAFLQDRKLWIQTGYGVEAKLPDSVCRRICDLGIAPAFKQGNYAGGLSAGLDAIEAALKDEYKGKGRTVAELSLPKVPLYVIIIGIVLLVLFVFWLSRVGRMYGSRGIVDIFDLIFRVIFYVLQSSGGGGYRGGSGGGFKGGGGRTGGGGAGGEW